MSEEKQGFFKRIINFCGEVKQEVRKVNWPSRDDLYGGTIVIISVLIIVCIGLGGLDWIFGLGIETLLSPK